MKKEFWVTTFDGYQQSVARISKSLPRAIAQAEKWSKVDGCTYNIWEVLHLKKVLVTKRRSK